MVKNWWNKYLSKEVDFQMKSTEKWWVHSVGTPSFLRSSKPTSSPKSLRIYVEENLLHNTSSVLKILNNPSFHLILLKLCLFLFLKYFLVGRLKNKTLKSDLLSNVVTVAKPVVEITIFGDRAFTELSTKVWQFGGFA